MLAIRLEKPLLSALDTLASHKHSNRSAMIREAIIRFLEDNEDIELATNAQRKMKSAKSLKQLRKELGLDD